MEARVGWQMCRVGEEADEKEGRRAGGGKGGQRRKKGRQGGTRGKYGGQARRR